MQTAELYERPAAPLTTGCLQLTKVDTRPVTAALSPCAVTGLVFSITGSSCTEATFHATLLHISGGNAQSIY